MKTITTNVVLPLLTLLLFASYTPKKATSNECDVKSFYEAISPNDSDTKVLTKNGELEEVEYILVPKRIEAGKYKVTLTRKGSNIYRVDNTKLWIETRYCYEYATWEEAMLIVESSYGYSRGKVIFK